MPDVRPTVNLDPVAQAIDRVLDHPWGRLAQRLFPEAAKEIRGLRDNLPTIAAEAQDAVVSEIREEARALERDAIDGVKKAIRGALKKGRKR